MQELATQGNVCLRLRGLFTRFSYYFCFSIKINFLFYVMNDLLMLISFALRDGWRIFGRMYVPVWWRHRRVTSRVQAPSAWRTCCPCSRSATPWTSWRWAGPRCWPSWSTAPPSGTRSCSAGASCSTRVGTHTADVSLSAISHSFKAKLNNPLFLSL